MSSPFRSSHRRSRSHSSLSTSTSSFSTLSLANPHNRIIRSPDDNVSHSPCSLPIGFSDALFHFTYSTQPPDRLEHIPIGGYDKEVRRDYAVDVDMDSCNNLSPIALNTSVSPSALPSMHFPSTSEAFRFSPSKTTVASGSPPPVPADAYMHADEPFRLARLHSDAFSDLRRSVAEAGEGFVRRMRELEACRISGDTQGVSLNSADSRASDLKDTYRKRSRKRSSPSFSRCKAQKRSAASSESPRRYKGDDGSSDIEMYSGSVSDSDDYPILSPATKRGMSQGALGVGVSVNLQTHLRSLLHPIPSRRSTRSRSPSAYTVSSEDESDLVDCIYPERTQQSRAVRNHCDTPPSPKSSTPASSFSSASNNSSRVSLTTPQAVTLGSLSSSPTQPFSRPFPLPSSESTTNVSKRRTEKAVAALTLALANGAGSVSDYEALKEARVALVMGDSDAGSLWD